MTSEATIKQKLLDDERAKANPDPEIIYALERTKNYWNTVDTTKLHNGINKINKLLKEESNNV